MLRWDIYRAAAKAKWIGTVEAVDADDDGDLCSAPSCRGGTFRYFS
jgi:hypothetical protein